MDQIIKNFWWTLIPFLIPAVALGDGNAPQNSNHQEEAVQKRQAGQKRHLLELRRTIENCNGSPEAISAAREAVDELNILDEEFRQNLSRVLEKLEEKEREYLLRDFEKRAAKEPLEDLEDLKEEVAEWASSHPHPKMASRLVRNVYMKIAQRFVQGSLARNPGAWESAKAVMVEASQLDGLSESDRGRIEKYISTDIPLAQGNAIASYGLSGNFLFWPYYSGLISNLQMNAWTACNSNSLSLNPFASDFSGVFGQPQSGAAAGGNLEACAAALSALRAAAALPAQAQAIDQQKLELAQQIQNAMVGNNKGTTPNSPPNSPAGTVGQTSTGGQAVGLPGAGQFFMPQNSPQSPGGGGASSNSFDTRFLMPAGPSPAYAGGYYGQINPF